jgi:hypothetical protein
VKKLTLDAEALRVETFEPREREARDGTVRGHEGTWGETCVTQCATGHCDCQLTVDGCG